MTFFYAKYTREISNYYFGILLKLEFEHFKQERHNFVTISDISKYTNLVVTIPILGER